ncbi:type II secretory pathway pseudopilin family protein [Streptococcus pneumoniae GA19101]|nr:type II secretory pathway pseudopilin family protein [Streptococcus pneumoniae GA19101]EJG39035.1 prepilin-type N-terminal cleavage/methylation domain protein [Streptococcus pneumoniae 2070108]
MIKAFTMLESLLVLGLVSILALGLSGSVQSTFAAVEEQIFFMEFEELYRETQKRSVASQQKTNLNLDGQTLSNGSQKLTVPKGIQAPSGQSITFDRAGGNSSLAKVEFQTSKGAIRYQLYLGNGKIKRIKETKIRAVILLEAVVALAIFASIATLLLGQIQKNRQEEAKILQKEEVLRVAKMALQTGQNQVSINGVEIQVFSSEKGLEVYHGSEQLLAIKEP